MRQLKIEMKIMVSYIEKTLEYPSIIVKAILRKTEESKEETFRKQQVVE